MKKAYEDYLQLKPYQFVSWLSQQFDIDTPYTFTTEDDINRGLEVLSVYAQNISFLEDMQSFCKLYCRELKRLGPATKSSYEDMVDRGAAIDNKISGLKVLYQALNKNITLISDQLKRLRNIPSAILVRTGSGKTLATRTENTDARKRLQKQPLFLGHKK